MRGLEAIAKDAWLSQSISILTTSITFEGAAEDAAIAWRVFRRFVLMLRSLTQRFATAVTRWRTKR